MPDSYYIIKKRGSCKLLTGAHNNKTPEVGGAAVGEGKNEQDILILFLTNEPIQTTSVK